jgi:hypothetical protein
LEARHLLDAALAGGRSYKTIEDLLQAIYTKP